MCMQGNSDRRDHLSLRQAYTAAKVVSLIVLSDCAPTAVDAYDLPSGVA